MTCIYYDKIGNEILVEQIPTLQLTDNKCKKQKNITIELLK
jgi:hypothetical protein